MKNDNIINDTVYGHIPYSGVEKKFLQSKIVNRLLFISQNALAYFAFPSISTKRYIHSLGTMHVASYIFKNAIINSEDRVVNSLLKSAKYEIERLIKSNELNFDLKRLVIDDITLKEFTPPLKDKYSIVYMILLQTIRLSALLHDVGHLPFSHQTEYALYRLYNSLKNRNSLNQQEDKFIQFYETITKKGKEVLHENIGNTYLDMLFNYEVIEQSSSSKELIKLYYLMVKNIFNNHEEEGFSYTTLHKIIASTVDADRIDYINRDLLASGYISSSSDLLRIARASIFIENNNQLILSFNTASLYDIEHLLESRFNLYKKVFFTYKIARLDTLLEKVITYLSKEYLTISPNDKKVYQTIAMMWKFSEENDMIKQLDIISQLDENWLITLFKKEYFKIKYQLSLTYQERYYLSAFEDILFGRNIFQATWKNLSEFYNILELSSSERYSFREKFGKLSLKKSKKLEMLLEAFIAKYNRDNAFFAYSIVSISIGIDKSFMLYDGEKRVSIDELSTVRKRLQTSRSNSVPFFLFSNSQKLTLEMRRELKEILFKLF